MKRVLLIIFSIIPFLSIAQIECSYDTIVNIDTTIYSHSKKYTLIFEDNFNDQSYTNSLWDKKEGVVRDFIFENQKAFHTQDNIIQEDGFLKIITKRQDTLAQYYDDTYQSRIASFKYTTGEIWTKGLFPINTKIEARIKLPSATGLWPAFWMFSQVNGNYNELDIFELFNIKKILSCNLFFKENYQSGENCFNCNFEIINNIVEWLKFISKYHTFAVNWEENNIIWTIDDHIVRTISRYKYMDGRSVYNFDSIPIGQYYESQFFPRDSMHIIFNTAVAVDSTNFPKQNYGNINDTMFIDYIRVYSIEDCNTSNLELTNTNYQSLIRSSNNDIMLDGDNVILRQGTLNLSSNKHIKIIANNRVYLDNGISINTSGNSEFSIEIEECIEENN